MNEPAGPSVTLGPADGAKLAPGTYEADSDLPLQAGRHFMSFRGWTSGCSDSGRFVVHEAW